MDKDGKAIISTQGRDNTARVLEPELAEAVRRVIAAAESDNTRRAHTAQWAKFEACAGGRNRKNARKRSPSILRRNRGRLKTPKPHYRTTQSGPRAARHFALQ